MNCHRDWVPETRKSCGRSLIWSISLSITLTEWTCQLTNQVSTYLPFRITSRRISIFVFIYFSLTFINFIINELHILNFILFIFLKKHVLVHQKNKITTWNITNDVFCFKSISLFIIYGNILLYMSLNRNYKSLTSFTRFMISLDMYILLLKKLTINCKSL